MNITCHQSVWEWVQLSWFRWLKFGLGGENRVSKWIELNSLNYLVFGLDFHVGSNKKYINTFSCRNRYIIRAYVDDELFVTRTTENSGLQYQCGCFGEIAKSNP